MLRLRLLAVGLLLSLLALDTASAGIFGFGQRRWERRKAELRSELVWQLENKLDQDLAREVESVTAELTATAENQVKIEAEKLEQQVQQALTQLREEASNLIAAEAKRLDQEIDKQVTVLQKQSQEQVVAEANKLKKQADRQIEVLTAKYDEQSKILSSSVEEQIAKLPAQISQEVDKAIKQRDANQAPGAPKENENPSDPGDDVSATQSSALPGKEVELAEHEAAGDPDDNAAE